MSNPCIVITGGSRGLGASIARRLWGAGWDLIIIGRDERTLHFFANSLGEKSNSEQFIKCLTCDLASPNQVESLVNMLSTLARVDALINNAAIHGPIGPLESVPMESWHEVIQVNLLAPVALCQGLLFKLMNSPRGGSIINISGGGATGPRPNFSAYATSKAGLVRFSETLAHESKGKNMRINCIAPGPMNTGLLQEVIELGENILGVKEVDMATNTVIGGNCSIEPTLLLIDFLLSEESKNISGKLVSSLWDDWNIWPKHIKSLMDSDAYTLRRIIGKERGLDWGDK